MLERMRRLCLVGASALAFAALVRGQEDPPPKPPAAAAEKDDGALPSIADYAAKMRRMQGFVDVYVDVEKDRALLGLREFGTELLYATANASGLGSNPIGIDRGSLGPQHVITFRRAGPKVLVLAKNLRFRALGDDARERRAVEESFAPAVLASLPIVAQDGAADTGGAVLVDATAWLMQDATGAADRMGAKKYRVDRERSALWLERTRAFPDNTEIEVLLTFATGERDREVARAAADATAVTLRQHHSLIRLPDAGYRPRAFDARVGYFGPSFQDYAAPLGASMHVRWIARHRLQKRDPDEAVSEPVEPIVYYVDPATPEPVRSALIEGASWWAEAFVAAGFKDAFRVELLPDGVDPMDVRYNMIHWVHRQTRGWSYGASVTDPRTGEILKGNVLLGSLRVRQDHLKFVGLQAPYANDGACRAAASPGAGHLIFGDDELAQEVSLQRIRQLAAHEVGHTLGLSHNFAASSYGRASVMDYPAPLVAVDGDRLDFSRAYDTGIGDYDTWAILYGYTQFRADQDEAAELDAIVRAGLQQGYLFLTDQDARGAGTGQPRASLWDNGSDPIAQLETELQVRAIALRRFGLDALRPGQSLASLEDALVPLYLHHRFQLEAAIKLIGGVQFRHAHKGDGQSANVAVPLDQQRRALELALRTLDREFLQLDPRILDRIPPAPPGHPDTAERFPRATGQPLDPIAMAAIAADLTLSGLLHRERAARLCLRGDGDGLTFEDVLDRIGRRAFGEAVTPAQPYSAEQRVVQSVFVDRLIDLAGDDAAAADVRAVAEGCLQKLADDARHRAAAAVGGWGEVARDNALVRRITAFLERRDREPRRALPLSTPPGSPIGSGVNR